MRAAEMKRLGAKDLQEAIRDGEVIIQENK
jgi:hypothetical protein